MRERVQRGHRGPVELVERGTRTCVARRGSLLQRPADAVAQLGGGLLGEGDRGDLPHRYPGAGDQRGHAIDEGLRLAGTRARLDEHRVVQVVDDRDTRRRVFVELEPELGLDDRHSSSIPISSPSSISSGSASATYASSSDAPRLRTHSR